MLLKIRNDTAHGAQRIPGPVGLSSIRSLSASFSFFSASLSLVLTIRAVGRCVPLCRPVYGLRNMEAL